MEIALRLRPRGQPRSLDVHYTVLFKRTFSQIANDFRLLRWERGESTKNFFVFVRKRIKNSGLAFGPYKGL